MRIILLAIFTLNFIISNAQFVFYSNDLSQKDIRKLVDSREKWKLKAEEYKNKLKELNSIPKTPKNNYRINKLNGKLYQIKSEIQGVKRLFEIERDKLNYEINNLQKNADENQKKIFELNSRISGLNKTIEEQQILIVNFKEKIDTYKSVINEQEKEIQATIAELTRTRLIISEKGTDLLVLTNKRKNIKTSFKDSDNNLHLKWIKKQKGFYIKTMYYITSREVKLQKKYPKAEFFLYKINQTNFIHNEKFTLNLSEVPQIEFKRKGASFCEYTEQGLLFWSIPIKVNLNKRTLKENIKKGQYYYILVIDDKLTIMDFFNLK